MTADKRMPITGVPMDFKFWEQAWRTAAKTALRSRRHDSQGQVAFWNERAAEFSSKVLPDTGRIEEIVSWLESQGVCLEGSTILDIGSGPGAFSLPFAARGAEVVALEPAAAMVAVLEKSLTATKLKGSIRVVRSLWEDTDIEARGWLGKFDLVFASMSPGINSWDTIERALKCSRRHCYFSSFAGERFNSHYRRLWQILYGGGMPPWPADIIYVNQLLLLRGFDVTFHVWNRRRPETLQAEEMVESFKNFFLQYGEEVPHMEAIIQRYVDDNLEDGLFQHEINTRLGKVLVKVQ